MIIRLLKQWLEEIRLINYVYQLVSPQVFSIKYDDIEFRDKVVIKPKYMAICHADQRYYLGKRDQTVLRKKLPMALIHECCGEVVYDPTGKFKSGELVAMIPNTPTTQIGDWHFPAFNFADAIISIGVMLILIEELFLKITERVHIFYLVDTTDF